MKDERMLELVVVGAGPHALSLLSRMLEDEPDMSGDFFIGLGSRPKSIVETKARCFPTAATAARQRANAARVMQHVAVIDPAGRWLARWDAQFEGLHIPHLRSPYDLHPAAWDSFALQGFVEELGLEEELTDLDFISNDSEGGAYKQGNFRTAQAALFMRFCTHVCARYGLEDAVTQGSVRRVEPVRGAGGVVESFEVHTFCGDDSGGSGALRVFRARRVVLAVGSTRRRRLPYWAEGLLPTHDGEGAADQGDAQSHEHPPGALAHAWDLLDGRGGDFRGGQAAWGGMAQRGAATRATPREQGLATALAAAVQPGIAVPKTAASIGAEVARAHAVFEALFRRTLSASRNVKFLAAVAKAAAAASGSSGGKKAVLAQRAVIAGFRKALELPRVAQLVAAVGAAGAASGGTPLLAGAAETGEVTAADVALGGEWCTFARELEQSLAVSAAAFALQLEAVGKDSAPTTAPPPPPPPPAPPAAAAAAAAAGAGAGAGVADGPLAGERVLLVGGGLTSAHLLRTALDGGAAHVTLCSRAALREKQFDLTLEWVGWRHRPGTLTRYLAEPSMKARLAALHLARGGGSVTPEAMRHLQAERAAGRASLLEQAEVVAVEWCEEQRAVGESAHRTTTHSSWRVDFDRDVAGELWSGVRADGGGDPCAGRFDRIWLATGSVLDVSSDPILGPLLASIAPRAAPQSCAHDHDSGHEDGQCNLRDKHCCDGVSCSDDDNGDCSDSDDASQEEVRVVGGLPVLHPSLALRRDVSCFVMGGYAALQLGPDALNLAGGRAGACRIASVIRGAVRGAAGVDSAPAEEAQRMAALERLRVRYNHRSGYVNVSVCDDLVGAAAQQQLLAQEAAAQEKRAAAAATATATTAGRDDGGSAAAASDFTRKPSKKERQRSRKQANAMRLAKRYVSGCEHDCAHAPRPGATTMEKDAAAAVQKARADKRRAVVGASEA